MATQNLGRVGLVLRGNWNSSTQYVPLDVVAYDGNAWAARIGNTNTTPTTSSSFWQLISNNATLVATVQGYKTEALASVSSAAGYASNAAASAASIIANYATVSETKSYLGIV